MSSYSEASNSKNGKDGSFFCLAPDIRAPTEGTDSPIATARPEDKEGPEIEYKKSLGALLALEILKSHITSQQKIDVLSTLANIKASIEIKGENNSNGKTPLMYAVESNERDLVAWLLDHDADVGATDNIGQTALFYAVCNSHVDVLRDLLARNPPLNTLNDAGKTLLELAIRDIQLVEILLDGGADIELSNEQGLTIMSIAVAEKNAELVQLLVDRGAVRQCSSSGLSINMDLQLNNTLLKNATRPIGGNPALRFATLNISGNVLPVLLEVPISFDSETGDIDGDSHLVLAPEKDPKGIRHLLQAGTNVNAQPSGETARIKKAQYDKDGLVTFEVILPESDEGDTLYNKYQDKQTATALNSSCSKLDLSSIHQLLKDGANPNDCDTELKTPPIITACCTSSLFQDPDEFLKKKLKVVEMLLDGGADLHREYQCTPPNALSAAALNRGVGMIDFLIEKKADPRCRDSVGRLPIHFAAANGLKNLQSLFSHAEDTIWSSDYTGKTPLHWAAQFGNGKTVEFILNLLPSEEERRVHVNQSDINGWTPICWAACSSGILAKHWKSSETEDFVETTRVLLKYGADISIQLPAGSESRVDVITPLNLAMLHGATVSVGHALTKGFENATGDIPNFERHLKTRGLAKPHLCDICLIQIRGLEHKCESCLSFYMCHKCHARKHQYHRVLEGGKSHLFTATRYPPVYRP